MTGRAFKVADIDASTFLEQRESDRLQRGHVRCQARTWSGRRRHRGSGPGTSGVRGDRYFMEREANRPLRRTSALSPSSVILARNRAPERTAGKDRRKERSKMSSVFPHERLEVYHRYLSVAWRAETFPSPSHGGKSIQARVISMLHAWCAKNGAA